MVLTTLVIPSLSIPIWVQGAVANAAALICLGEW